MTAPSRPSILFVDDDPLILQGLQRMLRSMRNDWSMEFVESGTQALELMATSPFQVVVSDMRMPVMNGAQLLTEIKNRFPDTVRLILSGHADKDLILECVGAAHQFLSKPCEPEAIKAAITRAIAFDASIKSKQIKKLALQMDKIPSIPSIYSEIVEKLRDENTSIDDLGDLMAKDLAITAKLLKIANSAFFGLRRQISSPAEAAAYLGVDTIKALVLSVNAFATYEGIKIPSLSLESLWSHGLSVGGVARRIIEAEEGPRNLADESFVAGMLHDIGKLVLAVNLPQDFQRAVALSEKEEIPLYHAEEQVFGANHADVGGFVLGLWGLPVRVVEAIAHHHDPEASGVCDLSPVIAVHVANAAVRRKENPSTGSSTHGDLRSDFLASLSFDQKLSTWMDLSL